LASKSFETLVGDVAKQHQKPNSPLFSPKTPFSKKKQRTRTEKKIIFPPKPKTLFLAFNEQLNASVHNYT
jgi:hypothetical protein